MALLALVLQFEIIFLFLIIFILSYYPGSRWLVALDTMHQRRRALIPFPFGLFSRNAPFAFYIFIL